MEEVECFRYLGVDIDRDGGMKSEMKHSVSEGEKVSGCLEEDVERRGFGNIFKINLLG
jgi:hypothetical protein